VGYVIAGERDHNCFSGAKKLVEALRSHGIPCEFESHPELAHAYPQQFNDSIDRAIAYFNK
jgi:predicted esterase